MKKLSEPSKSYVANHLENIKVALQQLTNLLKVSDSAPHVPNPIFSHVTALVGADRKSEKTSFQMRLSSTSITITQISVVIDLCQGKFFMKTLVWKENVFRYH